MTSWHLLTDPPDVPGLTFRPFGGPDDFPKMAAVLNASMAADGVDQVTSTESVQRNYEGMENCDPATDTVFAEIDGELVAYGRVFWMDEVGGPLRYMPFCYVGPEGRGKGIGTAMLAHNEARIRQIAATHPVDREQVFMVFHGDNEVAAMALYEQSGYEPEEYHADMVRPHLDDLPDAPMPEGLVVRTPTEAEMRQVFDAAAEAFRDHVGFTEPTEGEFQRFLDSPRRDPSLWRVAWDGDEVAGQVRSFINEEENEALGRKRGYTEDISVRRPYRRMGLARALLVQSLQAIEDRGMDDAELGVHTTNTTGAFDLYESVGFEKVRLWTQRRKPLA